MMPCQHGSERPILAFDATRRIHFTSFHTHSSTTLKAKLQSDRHQARISRCYRIAATRLSGSGVAKTELVSQATREEKPNRRKRTIEKFPSEMQGPDLLTVIVTQSFACLRACLLASHTLTLISMCSFRAAKPEPRSAEAPDENPPRLRQGRSFSCRRVTSIL